MWRYSRIADIDLNAFGLVEPDAGSAIDPMGIDGAAATVVIRDGRVVSLDRTDALGKATVTTITDHADGEAHSHADGEHHDDAHAMDHGPDPSKFDKDIGTFFSIYYCMTGLHAIHIIGGIIALAWLYWRSLAAHWRPDYFGPVDFVGLYWHLVDLIWIYLFPLLYLIE